MGVAEDYSFNFYLYGKKTIVLKFPHDSTAIGRLFFWILNKNFILKVFSALKNYKFFDNLKIEKYKKIEISKFYHVFIRFYLIANAVNKKNNDEKGKKDILCSNYFSNRANFYSDIARIFNSCLFY